ncbi:MalY/PatB family protein [Indiicoccus explosivorum]|uniref:MalY/PatB family protein n=1 Tax=Indiicoccus explosivorum TaxID=1917864 RepID=UPI001588228D|nr:MalY/PatB family protein [Indiicoccus explosivorum]
MFTVSYDRRNTNSVKWDMLTEVYGIEDASGILPMWVADMDFPIPQAVTDALKRRLEHPIFGYTYEGEELRSSVAGWLADRHGWKVEKEWLLFRHGVIPAIADILETFTEPGSKVAVTPPVYPPFFSLPEKLNREVLFCPLTEQNGVYSMNFDEFANVLRDADVFILCNPHNPGGKSWSGEELKEMIRLCAEHDVLIISDEIHADLVHEPNRHLPAVSVAGKDAGRIITCIAPTKTFNLAALQASAVIVPDADKRQRLQDYMTAHGSYFISALGAEAMRAAYSEGGPWLDGLKSTLTENIDTAIRELTDSLPGIRIPYPEATYLLWIDIRGLGYSEKEAMDRLLKIGKVALEPGTKYGPGGEGFLRMNIACPPSVLQDGVSRIVRALSK